MLIEIATKQDIESMKNEIINEMKSLLKLKATNPQQKEWLKSYEVRKLLSISPGKLQNMRVNGTIVYTKIGGLMFYKHSDIEKLMEENKHQRPLSNRAKYLEKLDLTSGLRKK